MNYLIDGIEDKVRELVESGDDHHPLVNTVHKIDYEGFDYALENGYVNLALFIW